LSKKAKKIKDTDYLFISTYLRALESKLLDRERKERVLLAKTDDDAIKVLEECGYFVSSPISVSNIEHTLSERRAAMMSDLAYLAPNPDIVDVFRIKYDYHNARLW